jgi:ABC-type amino acid transport substrate-binding protein
MIRELDTLLGRHDEAELVAVFPAPFDERSTILDILAGRVDLAPLSVLVTPSRCR